MLASVKQQIVQGKNLITFTGLRVAGQGLGMLVPLVVAKFFEPGLFASYSLAKMIVFFFTTSLITSAQRPFIVYANQEKVKTGKINKSFSIRCVFTVFSLLFFLVIILLFSKQIMWFTGISAGELIFIPLAFIGLAIRDFIGSLFLAVDERTKSSLVELTFGASGLLLIFAFYFAGIINIKTVFLAYLLSAFLVVALFIKAVDFKQLLPFVFDRKLFGEILNFTKWLVLGATAVYFVNWGDNLVLRIFVPMGDIGVYNFGYQFFKGFTLLTLGIGTYFLPFITQNIENKEKIRIYLYKKRPKILAVVLIVIAAVFALAPYLELVYSAYAGAVLILRMLLVATAVSVYNCFYGPIFLALKRYKFQQLVNIAQVVFNVLLDIILVPKLGIEGAAIATVIAYCINVVMHEVYFRVKLKNLIT